MKGLFYIAFLLLPFTCAAGFKVSGKVINIDDNTPVTSATVFLNNSLISGTTGSDGSFIFNSIKPGEYNLIVAIKGKNAYQQNIQVTDTLSLPHIDISLNAITDDEKWAADAGWPENYKIFKRFLLGDAATSGQCKILNPEILEAQYDSLTLILTVKAHGLLVIENQALGYRLKYLLTKFNYYSKSAAPEFSGNVFFEEMDGSPAAKARWQINRLNIYEGSAMNFFRSLINDGSIRAGFTLFQTVRDSTSGGKNKIREPLPIKFKALRNLKIHDMLKRTAIKGRFAFPIPDSLYVTFRQEKDGKITDPRQNSFATQISSLSSKYVYFDNNGLVINPDGVVFKGYWKDRPLTELLPVDFEPALHK